MVIGMKPLALTPSEQRRSDGEQYELAQLRDKGICLRCHREENVQMDHRQNRQDGNTTLANLQSLGMLCHLWKTEHPTDALREGWAMLRHTTLTPEEWPARRWLKTNYGILREAWVLYLPAPVDGEWWVEITPSDAARRLKKGGL